MTGKRIDENIKEEVIKAHSNGVSRKEIAEKHGISIRSVSRIVADRISRRNQELPGDIKAESERQLRIADLERRLELLEKRILDMDAKKIC